MIYISEKYVVNNINQQIVTKYSVEEIIYMSVSHYISDNYVVTHGIIDAIIEIFEIINYTKIDSIFQKFEIIHKIMNHFENKITINEQIKNQCLMRYIQYKKDILDNMQFLTSDILKHLIVINEASFNDMKKYGLVNCIEKTYLHIDFIMKEIVEHINYTKNGYESYYKLQRCKDRYALIKNYCGNTFVLDKDTNKGFIGYFRGNDVIFDRTKTVNDEDEWTFVKMKINNETVYRLV